MHVYVCAPLRDWAAFSKQSLCFAVDGCSLQVELVKADDSKGWTRVFEDSLVGAVAASAARDYTELADRMSGVPSGEGHAEQATLHAHDTVQQGGGKKAPLLQQTPALHSRPCVRHCVGCVGCGTGFECTFELQPSSASGSAPLAPKDQFHVRYTINNVEEGTHASRV